MVSKTCWWDVSPEHAYKHPNWLISKGPYCGYHSRSRCSRKPSEGPYFPYFPYFGGLCLLILPRHGPPNRDPLMVLPGWSAKTMRGSLFPLLPLRVKCQNHERVPISPISPILVVHVLARWEDIGHQNRGNRGNRDPLMVLALHP